MSTIDDNGSTSDPATPRASGSEPAAAARYRDALLAGHGVVAERVLAEVGRRTDALTVLEDVMAPALHEIGALWKSGTIGIAEEHLASEWAWRHVDEVRRLFATAPARDCVAAVGTVSGEGHVLPARMVADALALDGWTVAFLGGSMPHDQWVRYARKRGADLVALSVSTAAGAEALRELARALKELDTPPAILAGGAAVNGGSPGDFGVDAIQTTLREGVRWARAWAVREGSEPPLETWLTHLGDRIRALRKARGWNQGALAEAAGMHRAYVSAVEGGKQNLTVGALLRLAGALGVTLPELLESPSVPDPAAS